MTSFQMGFRTLAIEQRSSEVWKTLGAVKTEFAKFGTVLDGVKKKLDEASNKIDETGRRSRAMARTLREVEALPSGDSRRLLGSDFEGGEENE
jgi:DNA recombination protein RmuC